MKKIILSTLLMTMSLVNFAQDTITCSTVVEDTVLYVNSKTSAIAGIGIHQHSVDGTQGYEAFAQRFEAPDTVTVNGACFYAVMDIDPTDTLILNMYDVNGSGAPGTSVASVAVQVPSLVSGYTGAMDSSAIYLCGTFASPVQFEGDYFLSLENFNDTADIFIARNVDGDGAVEALTWGYYTSDGGGFDGWYNLFSFGAGWNFDVDIRPTVSYLASAEVILDTTLCYGDTLSVLSTTMIDDSLLYNKFYNPNFASYAANAVSDSINFGSGNTIDTSFVYATSGSYPLSVNHFVNLGWTVNGTFACQTDVNVYGMPIDLGADTLLCFEDSVTLFAGLGFDSYLWSSTDTDSAIVLSTTNLVDGDYTYFVEADANGCMSYDTVLVAVASGVVSLGADTEVCVGDSITFDAGAGFDSFMWNTSETDSAITVQTALLSDGTYAYFVDADVNGCASSDTIVLTVGSMMVSLGTDISVCSGDSAVVNAGAGFDSYLWSTADTDSMIVIQTGAMADSTYAYFIDATAGACVSSDTILITVGQLSVDLGGDTMLCWNTGESLILDAGTFDTYLWNTGQMTQTVQAGPASGASIEEYILEVTQGGCSGSDTITIEFGTCLGVEELTNTILVYPNPAKDYLTLQFDQNVIGNATVLLFDVSGKQIMNTQMNKQNLVMDVSNLESGMYILQIALENQVITKQVQIIR